VDVGVGKHPFVTLGIGAQANNREVDIAATERTQQSVDVPADAAAVTRNTRGVNQHPGRPTGGHSTPLKGPHNIRTTPQGFIGPVCPLKRKPTPVLPRRCARDTGACRDEWFPSSRSIVMPT
jgi:hypothetical protein